MKTIQTEKFVDIEEEGVCLGDSGLLDDLGEFFE
jgi:hypothetical protein